MPELATSINSCFKELLSGNPMPSTDSYLSDRELASLAEEVRMLPDFFFRQIGDWQQTRRATLFPKHPKPNYPKIGGLRGIILPRSEKWAPEATRFANEIAFQIAQAAKQSGEKLPLSLKKWQPNRVGFNLMEGLDDDPAIIPEHTDPPEETGVVVALELLGASAGQLTLIFCADTCAALGVDQPPHQLVSHETRLSLTLAELGKKAA